MSTWVVILPGGIRITVTPRRWLAAALCALLALLLWGFVAVLQQGVERGNRMRAEQLRAATQPPAAKAPRTGAVKTARAEPQQP
ncbi:MAG: hypothetical protein KIT60_15425 [Burkholderiaceae bacterium]|nr:hypothetical protein [Burkholderiaceae bacterium]